MTAQSIELEKIKGRIRTLLARNTNNGNTEAEMITAMEKVNDLLEQFNLTLTDVIIGSEQCVQKEIHTGSKHKGVQLNTIVRLGQFADCKVYQSRRPEGISLVVFGFETDVDMVIYLSEMISNVFDMELARFKETDTYINYYGHRRSLFANFLHGFSSMVNTRLVEMTKDRTNRANIQTGNALVLVKKSAKVEEEFAKMGTKLRNYNSKSHINYNEGAYGAGQSAGNRVNLSRPVSGNSKISGFLS